MHEALAPGAATKAASAPVWRHAWEVLSRHSGATAAVGPGRAGRPAAACWVIVSSRSLFVLVGRRVRGAEGDEAAGVGVAAPEELDAAGRADVEDTPLCEWLKSEPQLKPCDGLKHGSYPSAASGRNA